MGYYATGKQEKKMARPLVYGILLFQIALIISLIGGLRESYKTKERVELLMKNKERLVEENEQLNSEAAYVQSDYYVEKVAREELQRAKEGETVVILPPLDDENVGRREYREEIKPEMPVWRQWWELIIH